ncbi:hypothetical protein A3C98_00180 [Candidatus Roizmanbacteria bacterium RIFCSPHIGHO2_02_FULL_37_15]|uniref:O-antigen ligase-related domain-containing protein n=1 Tax=Candidatus Roizmanbacteria bacterium RIFCSPLOWO2_01_FULL_37_16 TaxID=1802058 RepID=A0A1F7IKS7_9BACT|nr:MAG: hypothetical protein A2859_04635 [Candidatus Roizmanbacteria bacterium RIFCSPHIGHO2_01_FULL_37_16b]OGK22295.1 MAG: hypothetical protein A3C98_00180 [Candidatus Roizmanbacteria bacterium RIFCSPHIGHO2_02_FULL_37_15]OGK31808.1 MAG: hypothetical protein A3F57_00505 [Candidatus Roizmanbacteria bacterium RIFCSPHIGHO2_12_FULL_36_11]OGK43967.1 MAG: hypothetical protein A3B40_04140 [Candidatus Roizmanbacteria bacterium RIFCSPLOWO2_01_FULL_37_16]OGK56458.1 MAG: hypothetical protein A3I50_00465 [C
MIDKSINFLYYLLFFITPLIMAPFTSELFEFNKMILIYLITLGILFFWSLKMILLNKIIIKKTPFDLVILFFLFSQTVATIFSIDPHTSFFGYYGRFNGGLLSILSYLILYYGFISNFSLNRQVLDKLLKFSLLSSMIVILWAIPGKFGRDMSCLLFMGQFNNSCWTDQFRPAERMFSTLGQPNWLGAYLAINFFIGTYFLFRKQANLRSLFIYSGYLFLSFSSILFTRSRSAFLSVVLGWFGFIILLFLKNKENFTQQLKKIILLSFLLIFSIVLFKTGIGKIDQFLSLSFYNKVIKSKQKEDVNLTKPSGEKQFTRDYSASSVTTSSEIRKIVWRGAINLGIRYPFFGTGVETFAYSYYFVRPKEHNLTSEWDYLYNKAHNEFLNYLATTGIVGLGAYLLMIVLVIVHSTGKIFRFNLNFLVKSNPTDLRRDINQDLKFETLEICLLLSYFTILVTNFFGFSTTTINLFFYLIPAFLVISSQKLEQNKDKKNFVKLTTKRRLMLLILTIALTFFLIYFLRYYFADIKYAEGENFSKIGEYQKAAQLLNQANTLKYDHVYEDKLSYTLANIAFIASYQKQNDVAEKMMKTADLLNNKSIVAAAKNVLYWKTKAKNHYLFYQITLDPLELKVALDALEKARLIAPSDPKIPYSLAIFYSLLADEAKKNNEKLKYNRLSLIEIDKSIDLKNNYRDGYFLKGQILKKTSRFEEAKKVFNFILHNLNPDDNEVKKELDSI